jgi:GTP cyclohydrolase I
VIDKSRIEKAVSEILLAIGEDPERDGLKETPMRVARMYEEIFAGVGRDPASEIKMFRENKLKGMVSVKDIHFYSVCEHHLMPFFGHIHVVYIPRDGRIAGISKIARVTDILSKKPQLQERLTHEIGETLMNGMQALGTAVVIEAEHLCMAMRGIRRPGAKTVTSDFHGVLADDAELRAEALKLLNEH